MSDPDALDRTTQFVRLHPDLHNQRTWMCGTTACYAGWTVLLEHGYGASSWRIPEAEEWEYTLPGGTQVYSAGTAIQVEAMRILRVSDDEADALFSAVSGGVLLVADALAARDRGLLDDAGRALLDWYSLSTWEGP